VANRLTHVPDRPVPALGGAAVLVPLADAFMAVMLSRPATGSLRQTWVTPATLWLCSAVAVLGAGVAAWLVANDRGGPLDVWLLCLGALIAGAGSVAILGACQRRRIS
jgi:hypothetical protein